MAVRGKYSSLYMGLVFALLGGRDGLASPEETLESRERKFGVKLSAGPTASIQVGDLPKCNVRFSEDVTFKTVFVNCEGDQDRAGDELSDDSEDEIYQTRPLHPVQESAASSGSRAHVKTFGAVEGSGIDVSEDAKQIEMYRALWMHYTKFEMVNRRAIRKLDEKVEKYQALVNHFEIESMRLNFDAASLGLSVGERDFNCSQAERNLEQNREELQTALDLLDYSEMKLKNAYELAKFYGNRVQELLNKNKSS